MTTGPGSNDAAPRTDDDVDSMGDRLVDELAEEVVEELDLHRVAKDDEQLPSMSEQISEQLGGVRGLIESSIPVLLFVLLNVVLGDTVLGLPKKTALYWAIGAAVGSAVLIGVFRLLRKQSVRHAVNGLIGIAFGAYLAYRSGEAKDFYLPGIWFSFGQAALLVLSVVFGKPIVGYVWGVLANKGKHDWFGNRRLFRTFQWLTIAWAALLTSRAGLQYWLYLEGQANAIGIVRILISWPTQVAMFVITVWAVRRVTRTSPVVS